MDQILELMSLKLQRELGQHSFPYWAQARPVPEQALARRCRVRLAPLAAGVFKHIVLFMISFRTIEAHEDNWCYRRTGTDPAEPDHRTGNGLSSTEV